MRQNKVRILMLLRQGSFGVDRTLSLLILLIALIMALLRMTTWAAAQSPLTETPAAQAPAALADQPYLSEAAPVAGGGKFAWAELTIGQVNLDLQRTFIPLVRTAGSPPSPAPAAADNPQLANISIAGWKLSDQDGNVYIFPGALTSLPKGTVVLVIYDGLGPGLDETDPSDGRVTVHTPPGLANIFDAQGDQLALFDNLNAMVDFVAWGQDPLGDEAAAVTAGLWTPGVFLIFDQGFGSGVMNVPPGPDFSYGIWYDDPGDGLKNWLPYSDQDSSPGWLNGPPAPLDLNLPDGALVGSETFSLYWTGVPGAQGYQVELSTTPPGSAAQEALGPQALQTYPVTQPTWKPGSTLPDGDYYVSIAAVTLNKNLSNKLGPIKVSVVGLNALIPAFPHVLLLNANEYKIQHKDSPLLDIGGGPNNVVGANNPGDRRFPIDKRWDGEHQDGSGNPNFAWNGIDNWYCVRASTAMLADYYGGSLSQDRLSFHSFEEWASSPAPQQNVPEHDLGFGVGIGSYTGQDEIVSWALGTSISGILYCPPNPNDGKPYTCPNPGGSPITWTQVKTWIDAGRPFASVNLRNAHMRVVDGYLDISPGSRWIHVLDPVPADVNSCATCPGARWESFPTFSNTHERALVGPAGRSGAPNVRSDEASIWQDSDGDGVSNFDETQRFFTDPNDPDTDGDWVNDKNDLAEYIFDDDMAIGNYIYTPGMQPNTSNYDNDSKRKELDWDNDNDGSPDGCEDANGDGIFDPATETSNFNAASEQVCQPRFSIISPDNGQAANAGDPASPGKVLIRLDVSLPPALPGKPVFSKAQFSAQIGGLPAPAISGVQVASEFWLLVQAPVQAAQAYYDLAVSFDGTPTGHNDQNDLESSAVFYNPRPPMDTLVVLDTSGSMASSNKLADAKNAARLYLDQWQAGDMLGLVSFDNSGHLISPLTGVAANLQVITDTKTLLNGLSAAGNTAMGAGLKLGQDQLVTNGNGAHDQSLMLLTDGAENVPPFWADPTVSGVIVPSKTVVNTVGFGQASDAWFGQLSQIASSTGGVFGAVDDPSISPIPAEALATQTANQLADGYKYAAERLLNEQRLFEATGIISRANISDTLTILVGNTPSLVIGANFDLGFQLALDVFDPNGQKVNPSGAGIDYRLDATHEQYRIPNPMAGSWKATLRYNTASPLPTEYMLFSSARSNLQMHLVAAERIRSQFQLIVFLSDSGPLTGASVQAQILRPDKAVAAVTLFDDGAHGDAAAGDGVYGAQYAAPLAGAYLIKVSASGGGAAAPGYIRFAQTVIIN